MGGGRSSRLSSILYIVLHVSEPIEVGGGTESLEHSCNNFFQFRGIEERMLAIILSKVTLYIEFFAKGIFGRKWPSQEPKRSGICFIPA